LKRKQIAVATLIAAILVLAACSRPTIVYEGKERPASEVEDIMGDKLEVENPGLDIEVRLSVDSD